MLMMNLIFSTPLLVVAMLKLDFHQNFHALNAAMY
jgi:hypothetical protein